ncbi:hypothetical protein LX15_005136 [Streptoalloteichus tenebrarius]|uniref:Uncharacterized protein n=1 Tax=Streptoalloteichus tenebrarius (strain ATCC 17920 / DSM 40477 / JCM 4838 / CBS 697.72 / NBRC 16177 / NCIMB 11028 / NRRL B-12390 / A12253. 1 / ISP 5477) TaxID=1933 RepID=A0ABT1I1E8_STRSD|nr:hypothetical protein [Streptoalloteichus tenebrarius]MCP2261410.1 hypothetical protein [Streptoalloteichus tenebrarius]BFF02013.1 hypothetical protein GCM10020241_36880 [Streptoalloteichus tenebrarius]
MHPWAKRGIHAALVTGGMLAVGGGVSEAVEPAPDRPTPPLGDATMPLDVIDDTFDRGAVRAGETAPAGTRGWPEHPAVRPEDVLWEIRTEQSEPVVISGVAGTWSGTITDLPVADRDEPDWPDHDPAPPAAHRAPTRPGAEETEDTLVLEHLADWFAVADAQRRDRVVAATIDALADELATLAARTAPPSVEPDARTARALTDVVTADAAVVEAHPREAWITEAPRSLGPSRARGDEHGPALRSDDAGRSNPDQLLPATPTKTPAGAHLFSVNRQVLRRALAWQRPVPPPTAGERREVNPLEIRGERVLPVTEVPYHPRPRPRATERSQVPTTQWGTWRPSLPPLVFPTFDLAEAPSAARPGPAPTAPTPSVPATPEVPETPEMPQQAFARPSGGVPLQANLGALDLSEIEINDEQVVPEGVSETPALSTVDSVTWLRNVTTRG